MLFASFTSVGSVCFNSADPFDNCHAICIFALQLVKSASIFFFVICSESYFISLQLFQSASLYFLLSVRLLTLFHFNCLSFFFLPLSLASAPSFASHQFSCYCLLLWIRLISAT